MTIRKSGRATPEGRTLRPGKAMAFKPSHADTLRANKSAMQHYATLSGRETPVEQLALQTVKPKQTRAKAGSNTTIPLERDVQRAIIEYLSAHRGVAFYGRFNSGTAITGDAQGNTRYTRFNTIKGFPDIHGMMKGGTALYIEVKRPGGRLTDEQDEFLQKVRDNGGIGFMAQSVDDVMHELTLNGYWDR